MTTLTISGRGLTAGRCRGPLLGLENPLNLYGDVDPKTGTLRGSGVRVSGAVIAVKAVVGSTVAPYIAYALRRQGLAPCAIATTAVDPVVVAAAVLGNIVLVEVDNQTLKKLISLGGSCTAEVESNPPRAELRLTCHHPSQP